MKRIISLILVFTAILIYACNSPKSDTKEYPLQGAWELTSVKYVSPDTTYETTKFDNPNVKLLTKRHYAFGLQTGENSITGGGGEYSYDGNTFTSYPKYHGSSAVIGRSLKWKSTLNGDLWTISMDTLNVHQSEIWKRIE